MAPGILDSHPTLHEQFVSHGSKELDAHPDHAHHTSPTKQPDIDWLPSLENYQKRVTKRLKHGNLEKVLPNSFPSSVHYQMCWAASGISSSEYLYDLSSTDVDQINHALQYFKGLGLPKDNISRDTFPLFQLGRKLDQVAQGVHDGRGIAVLRGLDPSKYDLADNVILYAGVASYIGEKRGTQDRGGNVLVHIKDVGDTVDPEGKRQSPYTNNAQPFHTDLGDVIAMYVMDVASTGGKSFVASAAQVYNEIAATRPDLIHVLANGDWAFDKHEDDGTHYSHPILCYDAKTNRVSFCFSRRQLTGSSISPRPASLPPLTDAQAEALDAIHFTAAKHALSIQLQRGDMAFINNLGVFHSREAFTDNEDRHRHIIRMWLRNEKLAWQTPDNMEEVWSHIYGGVCQPVWYMSPNHDLAHVISRKATCFG